MGETKPCLGCMGLSVSHACDGMRRAAEKLPDRDVPHPWLAARGPAESVLRLLEQGEITRRKALELLVAFQEGRPGWDRAPWSKLNWCDDDSVECARLEELCHNKDTALRVQAEALQSMQETLDEYANTLCVTEHQLAQSDDVRQEQEVQIARACEVLRNIRAGESPKHKRVMPDRSVHWAPLPWGTGCEPDCLGCEIDRLLGRAHIEANGSGHE